jgi:hypothetical protein
MCRLLLGLIIFAFPAYGLLIPTATDTSAASATSDSFIDPSDSFIYPGVSDNPVANVSDIVVYQNDTMVVEYSQLEWTTTLLMSMNCFINQTGAQTVDPQAIDGETGWVSQFGPYENTGLVLWNFSSVYVEDATNYCRFLLYNESLNGCSWDPWGQEISPPINYWAYPFAYSPIFQVLTNVTSDRKPKLWTQEATATQKVDASKTISTTQIATCPPSGIPASPTPSAWAVDMYPPLDDGLEFPFDPKVVVATLAITGNDY